MCQGGLFMLLTAKKIGNNWIIFDEDNIDVAKVKIMFKDNGTYGKIIYSDGSECELLHHPYAFKNQRSKVNIFIADSQFNNAFYRRLEYNKSCGFYFDYELRLNHIPYKCNIFFSRKNRKKSQITIYNRNVLVAAIDVFFSDGKPLATFYVDDTTDAKTIILIFMAYDIFAQQKSSNMPILGTGLRDKHFEGFIARIKEFYIGGNI